MDPASVQVLTNAALFRSIAAFLPGVANVVQFVLAFELRERTKHHSYLIEHSNDRKWPWVLPMYRESPLPSWLWAIALADKNRRVLSALLELSRNPNSYAVSPLTPSITMGFVVSRMADDGDFIDWIYTNFTAAQHREISDREFQIIAENGNLEIVRWVQDRGYELPATMLDVAAGMGNMALVRYLEEHGTPGCVNLAMGYAAEFGHLDIVKFLHENRSEASNSAVCDHQSTISRDDGCESYLAIAAARNGHLDCIKYAHEHNFPGFTARVMAKAALYGHLNIVKFLHKRRTEGCTISGLRNAQGHVSRYLHRRRPMRQFGTERQDLASKADRLVGYVEGLFRGELAFRAKETYEYPPN